MALFLRSSRNFIPNENERGSTMNEYPHLNHARHMWLFGGKCGTTAPFVAVEGKGNGHLSKREIEKGVQGGGGKYCCKTAPFATRKFANMCGLTY